MKKLFRALKLFSFIIIFANLAFAGETISSTLQPGPRQEIPTATIDGTDVITRAATDTFSPATAIKNYYVDPYTGSANFTIPIALPPARKNLPLKLNLVYSSRAGNGWLGVGWKLDLGVIERSTKNGYPKYDSTDKFVFSLGEQQDDLVYIGGQEYRPKTADIAWKFIFDGSRWIVKDNLGNTYYFGLDNYLNDSSRTKDPNNSGKVFRWCLSKITDTSGNNIIFKYLKDRFNLQNRVEIYYSEKTEAAKSSYKENDYNYLVLIMLSPRTNAFSNYRAGFRAEYPFADAGRITEIKILYRSQIIFDEPQGGQLINRYALEYVSSSISGRSLLKKISEYGSDDTIKNPPITFKYEQPETFKYNIIKSNQDLSVRSDNLWNVRFAPIPVNLAADSSNDYALYPSGFVSSSSSELTSVSWNQSSYKQDATFETFSWSTSSTGNIKIQGKKNQAFHIWTYVLSDTVKNITLPFIQNCNARTFISNGVDSWSANSFSLPMSRYVRIDITGYGFDNDFSFDLNLDLSGQVKFMNSQLSMPAQLSGDFNGDGVTDLGTFIKSEGRCEIFLSNKAGFQPKSDWITNFGKDEDVLLGDFNADGKTDLCAYDSARGNFKVALSDGTKFVDKGIWLSGFRPNTRFSVGDFNGDGLTDIYSAYIEARNIYIQAAFSNGIKFISQDSLALTDNGYWDDIPIVLSGDFNGDGMTDFCYYDHGYRIIEYHDEFIGRIDPITIGWTQWIKANNFLVDFDSDGNTDFGVYCEAWLVDDINDKDNLILEVYSVNTGRSDFIKLLRFNKNLSEIQNGDFNGDGIVDFCAYNPLGQMEIGLSSLDAQPDLLTGIDNGWGASIGFDYKSSMFYENTLEVKPGLPFSIPMISKVTISNSNVSDIYQNVYNYSQGLYDAATKEFRGFGYASVTDNTGNLTETWFLQDAVYKGKVSKQRASDKNGGLFSEIKNTWTNASPYPETYIVSLAETNEYTYDADSTFKQKKTTFTYDSFGNQTRAKEWGDASISSDERETVSEYKYNTSGWLISYPNHIYILDATAKKVSEKWLYYDNFATYTDIPVKGLLTKEESWLYNPLTQSAQRIAQNYAYDTFGNPTKTTDPLTRATTTDYDADLHTYPVKLTNALGQVTQSTYDPKTGQVLTATDANNQTTKNIYDNLGRLIKVVGPNDTEDNPGVVYEYELVNLPLKVTQKTKTSYTAGTPAYLVTHSFYDGLGRLIQTKSQAEADPQTGSSRQIVSDVFKYDQRGNIKEKFLPYFAETSDSFNPDYTDKPKFTFAYDCLGRLTQINNPDGTYRQNIYSDWATTFIDENNHQTKQFEDAFGNIIKVEEYNSTQIYTTRYFYDTLDNLVRITDSKNNSTYFSYDSLGRKLKTNDPDMGIWNYEYDLAGNLVKQVDARGQIIEFTYDSLNRIKTKKAGGITLASYTYDEATKQFCIGRLSKITDTSGSTEFFYDKEGRIIKSIKTISGASFTTERAYDALDRLLTLKYPDAEILTYIYNPQGIETIKGLSPQGATIPYVLSVDYSPTSQITRIKYGNNTETKYAYDPQTLRLEQILTQSPAKKIQDLNYYFDNVGNVKNIQDYVNTSTQSFLYDDLNRLISAQGAYGAFTYAYDSIGNLTHKEGINYSYSMTSKPHAVRSTSDATAFEYDSNGNLVRKSKAGLSQKFIYNLENQLIKAEESQDPTVKTISIYLHQGVNFFSLPFGPSFKIKEALASIQASRQDIVYWDVSNYNYIYNVNDPDFDQFDTLEYTKGYWIYITNPSGVTLNITGRMPDTHQQALKTGWNAIGSPKDTEADVEAALKPLTLGIDYSKVGRYNSPSYPYYQEYSATAKEFTKLKPGEAYWLKMLKDTTWNINNTVPATSLAEFSYDYTGTRVKKTASGKTTTYIDSLFEKDSDGRTRKHIFLGASRICTKGLSPQGTDPKFYYYHSDHLGSSNVITDSSGNQVYLAEYRPFGSLTKGLSPQGTIPDYLYTGKEFDRPTSLYYYGQRYYSSSLGKFTQPDPIIQDVYDPQNLNHYAYCRNNPLILTDPDGTSWSSTWNSWSSDWSSGWNSFTNWGYNTWNNFSNSWRSTTQSLRQGWNNFSNFTRNSINSFTTWSMQSFSSIGSGLSNFGRSTWRETNIWGSTLGMGIGYGLGQMERGWNDFALKLPSNDIFKGMQRFGSGFLSGLNKNFTDLAFKDLWSNAIYQPKLSPIRTGLNAVQILGVGITTMGIVQPYSNPRFSIDKAQTMVAIKGIKALGVTFAAGIGGLGGYGLGGGPINPIGSAFTMGGGAVIAGGFADYWLSRGEKALYKWTGWE